MERDIVKKSVKVFMGIFVMGIFLTVLAVFVRPYFTNDIEEETPKKQNSIKPPKQLYEIGEDMEVEGLVFHVSEAELFEDYEKIDAFYKERRFVQSREEYVKAYIEAYEHKDFFTEDIRYFRIKCFVTNHTEKAIDFYLESMYPTSIVGSSVIPWYFKCYDGRGVSDNNQEKELSLEGKRKTLYIGDIDKGEPYILQPKECIEIEVVGEFCLLDIYPNLNNPNNSYDLYFMRDNSTKKIRLNITGSFDDKNSPYLGTRNIPEMKSRSWTNLERKIWNEEFRERSKKYGYSYSTNIYLVDRERELTEVKEPGQKFLELWNKHWTDGRIEAAFCLETTLTNYEIVEWKNLPSDFIKQGNLQRMAKRYHDIHNCREEDLKVLILDLNYTSSQIGELPSDEKEIVNYFYERSKIYIENKDQDEVKKLHKEILTLFGTADDWIVTENSAYPENIGFVSMEHMGVDEDISCRMAYILPPQLYDEYLAVYFTGGKYNVIFDAEDIPRTKIDLQ